MSISVTCCYFKIWLPICLGACVNIWLFHKFLLQLKNGSIKFVLPFGNALQELILSRCLLLCVSEVDLPFDDEVFEEDEVILGLLEIDLGNPDLFLCGLKFVSCQVHLIVFLRHCLKTVILI